MALSTSDREALAADLDSAIGYTRDLGYWLRTAQPEVDGSTSVSFEEEVYLDLGEFGEQSTYKQIERDEVEVTVEVDVESLIRDETSVTARYLEDDVVPLLEAARDEIRRMSEEVEVGGQSLLDLVGGIQLGAEERAGLAARAVVDSFLTGYGIESVRRSLAYAFKLSVVDLDGPADLGYDPLTVELSESGESNYRLEQIRLGDDITGASFGRVVKVAPAASGAGYDLTVNRDGFERVIDNVSLNSTFYVIPVADRDSKPTAVSLLG